MVAIELNPVATLLPFHRSRFFRIKARLFYRVGKFDAPPLGTQEIGSATYPALL
jgi:hypothetical protein